jgi:hypothetical protein
VADGQIDQPHQQPVADEDWLVVRLEEVAGARALTEQMDHTG